MKLQPPEDWLMFFRDGLPFKKAVLATAHYKQFICGKAGSELALPFSFLAITIID